MHSDLGISQVDRWFVFPPLSSPLISRHMYMLAEPHWFDHDGRNIVVPVVGVFEAKPPTASGRRAGATWHQSAQLVAAGMQECDVSQLLAILNVRKRTVGGVISRPYTRMARGRHSL